MNPLHATVALFVGAYLALKLALPRHSRVPGAYVRFVVLCAASALALTPFLWLLCAAFKDPEVLMRYTFLPPLDEIGPDTINLANFRTLFEPTLTARGPVYFYQYILNSVFLACTATAVQLLLCSMAGYALAKLEFPGKRPLMLFMLGTLTIPPMLLLAPLYELIVRLGWIDTYWALIVPGAVTAFGAFLFRQAIVGVPSDLVEAGRIDGCGEFRIYWELVMPVVRPMSAAFCLISFLGAWNNFLGPQIFMHSQEKQVLPVVMSQYIGIYSQQYGVFLAGTLLSIVPPAVLFFALQREFIAGLTSGAVKG